MSDTSTSSFMCGELAEHAHASEASPATTRNSNSAHQQRAYERKFADLLFLLRTSKEELIVVHRPQVLGDNYDEIVESLNRFGEAGKRLAVLPKRERS